MTPFGSKLKSLRKEKNVSITELAKALKISTAYLSMLENGKRGNPPNGMVELICAYFGLIWDDSEELKSRYDTEESVSTLIDLSQDLEGIIRNVGTHAGGVVIAPSKISDFCPIYKGEEESDVIVSQFDKDDVEAVGLVKFDFLGLSNLTVMDKAIKIIKINIK